MATRIRADRGSRVVENIKRTVDIALFPIHDGPAIEYINAGRIGSGFHCCAFRFRNSEEAGVKLLRRLDNVDRQLRRHGNELASQGLPLQRLAENKNNVGGGKAGA
ncbi:hypothetical protein CBM2634_A90046 [Cupriavidus taiwanensis]|uniref:Uncharacterized protein n=1 Tax=Cupriavidus taiwanensis TaxID=164546 RepID=A0A375J2Y6_9BURK|nr:hypothetical protein CBM2634_A90046 [Cupriavidus taiwanensis]